MLFCETPLQSTSSWATTGTRVIPDETFTRLSAHWHLDREVSLECPSPPATRGKVKVPWPYQYSVSTRPGSPPSFRAIRMPKSWAWI